MISLLNGMQMEKTSKNLRKTKVFEGPVFIPAMPFLQKIVKKTEVIEIEKTNEFDLPIITRIVLKEVQELIFNGTNKKGVPFYSEGSSSNNFTYL